MSAPSTRSVLLASRRPFLVLRFLPPLVTRLVLGHAYYQTGLGKWTHFDNAVTLFAAVGLPLPEQSVFLVSRLETFGGIALALGLLTRPVAAVLAIVMSVALATADRPRLLEALGPDRTFGPADITSFVFLLLLSWLVAYGPGPLSVDRLVARVALRLFPARRSPEATPVLAPNETAPSLPAIAALWSRDEAPPALSRPQDDTLRPEVHRRTARRRRR